MMLLKNMLLIVDENEGHHYIINNMCISCNVFKFLYILVYCLFFFSCTFIFLSMNQFESLLFNISIALSHVSNSFS